MDELKKIVSTQRVTRIHEMWSDYKTENPYHVAYMAYINSDTGDVVDDLNNISGGPHLSLSVELEPLSEGDYQYTDDTIVDAVLDVYNEFPEFDLGTSGNKDYEAVNKNVAANKIAQNTKRGAGKEVVDGFIIYKGVKDQEVPPTLTDVIKLNLRTALTPEYRFYYTIARNQYRDRDKYPYPNVDGGVIVSEAVIDGVTKYAIFKHPNFESYGFKLVYQ